MFEQFEFGEFRLDIDEERLYRGAARINVNRRTLQVLRLLVERPQTIITKQEFFDCVWADAFVEEANLSVAVAALRKVLGDDPKQPRFIENLPRKGYRFVGEVKRTQKNRSINFNRQPPETNAIDETAATPPLIAAAETAAVAPPQIIRTEIETAPAPPRSSSVDAADKRFAPKYKTALALGLLSLLLITVSIAIAYRFSRAAAPAETVVAVMPFENENDEIEFLSDGFAQAIGDSLATVPNLRVIGGDSIVRSKNRAADAASIGRESNAAFVITGKTALRDNRVSVAVELSDGKTNRRVWSREYENRVEDALTLSSQITREINGALLLLLRPTAENAAIKVRRATDDGEAYLLYLKARYHWNKRAHLDTQKAIEYYQQALDKDPTFALAYVGLAASYSRAEWIYKKSAAEKTRLIEGAARKALEIDPNLGEAYAIIALNQTWHECDLNAAAGNFRRALELNPQDATTRHWHAEFLAMRGLFDNSFREYDRALALEPLSFAIMTDRAFNFYYARQPERAIEELQKIAQINSDYERTYSFLSFIYEEQQQFEAALHALDKHYRLQNKNGQLSNERLTQIQSYSQKSLEAFKESGANGYWRSRIDYELFFNDGAADEIAMTRIYAKLNELDRAFEHLNRVIEKKDSGANWLKIAPHFDRLRSDQRFGAALRRVGLK